MRFSDKQKKVICLIIAVVMIVPLAISAVATLASF